jgi:hypothetical protein
MKKIYLLMTMLLALCLGSYAGGDDDLSLTTGWNCSLEQESTAPMYPSQVTISGQWRDIRICDSNFSAKEWVRYKIIFAEPFTDSELVQVMVRNAAEASSYSGHYFPIQAGVTEVEGNLSDIAFKGGDSIITVLGIQDRKADTAKFVLNDVILYKADGTEWHPNLAKDWGSSFTKLGQGVITEYYSLGQWGTLAHNFGSNVVVGNGDVHRFTFTSSVPFPEGLQWKVLRGSADGLSLYPGAINAGDTIASIDINESNILKSDTDTINYYTGVAIQATASARLPKDVKLSRSIIYGNGALSREQMPVIASYGAKVVDPHPAESVNPNGLPVRVTLPGSWGAIKIWLDSIDVATYPSYKIVLRDKPATGTIQMFYRNRTQGNSGGVYVPWATDSALLSNLSEDGKTLTGDFSTDALEGDNMVLAFCLQNMTSSSVNFVVDSVLLINEDGEEIPTSGLSSSGIWNGGTTTPLGGSYDENGNIYDAFVTWSSTYGWEGSYSGTVAENTYHRFTFYTDTPLPDSVQVICFDGSYSAINVIENGKGTTTYSVDIPSSYSMFALQYKGSTGLPFTVRFNKIIREVFEGSIATSIKQTEQSSESVTKTQIFNASGIRLTAPARGLNIIRQTLSDGSVRTKKVMIK